MVICRFTITHNPESERKQRNVSIAFKINLRREGNSGLLDREYQLKRANGTFVYS
jgi:hypothetical protein